jgi:hypothetical protein
MTKQNVVAVLIVAAVFVGGGLVAGRTLGTNGQDAIDRMSADERVFLVKLQSLRRGMSFEQVVETLGRPDDEGPLQMRPRWAVGGNPLNAAVVYIHPDGANHFTWISIGRFTYEGQLRAGNPEKQ